MPPSMLNMRCYVMLNITWKMLSTDLCSLYYSYPLLLYIYWHSTQHNFLGLFIYRNICFTKNNYYANTNLFLSAYSAKTAS